MSRVIARHDDDVDVAAVDRAARRAFWWREGMILAGFVLLLVAAVFTVAVPELRKEPEGQGAAADGASASAQGEATAAPTTALPAN